MSDAETSNWEEINSNEAPAVSKTTGDAPAKKELLLSLNFSNKELITLYLGKYTAILLGKSISKGAQKKLIKKTNDLMSNLIELKVREDNEDEKATDSKPETEPTDEASTEASNEQKPANEASTTETAKPTESSNEMIKDIHLALPWELRAKIIDQLVVSMNAAVLNCKAFKEDAKSDIVKQNMEMCKTLSDLAFSVVEQSKPIEAESDDELEAEEKKSEEESKTLKVDKVTKTELVNDITRLTAAVKDLSEKFERLAMLKTLEEKDDPAACDGVVFDFELKNVKDLIEAKNIHYSDTFRCYHDLPWQGCVDSRDLVDDKEVDKTATRFMGFYLRCEYNSNYPGNWSVKTSYELRLLNQLPGKCKRLVKYVQTFNKIATLGNPKFITASELLDESKGWVKDDTIKLQIHLRTEKLVRK